MVQIRALLRAGFGSDVVSNLLPCVHGDEPVIDLYPQVAAEMRRMLAGIEDDLRTLTNQRNAVLGLVGVGSLMSEPPAQRPVAAQSIAPADAANTVRPALIAARADA